MRAILYHPGHAPEPLEMPMQFETAELIQRGENYYRLLPRIPADIQDDITRYLYVVMVWKIILEDTNGIVDNSA